MKKILLLLLILLFSASLFKNISYPLLWNDEAETVSFGQSILNHGYPKIHDGKNVLYPLLNPDLSLGEDKKTDAFIGSGWGGFYFATIGITLANTVNDFYVKTALLRIPFAILGFCAVIILALMAVAPFRKKGDKISVLSAFFFFELLSVSLVLHLREVRYYSLQIFLSAALLYIYAQFKIFRGIGFRTYLCSLILFLFILFNTFIPAYLAFSALLVVEWCWAMVKLISKKEFIISGGIFDSIKTESKPIIPLIISLISVMPVAIFFRTQEISRAISEQFNFTWVVYYEHIVEIISFLGKYEFLYLIISVKCFTYVYSYVSKSSESDQEERTALCLSNSLWLYSVFYVIFVARLPFLLYQRYYILLQPVAVTMLMLDTMVIMKFIARSSRTVRIKWLKVAFLLLGACLFLINGMNKIDSLKGHLYELTHPYRGPLDFVIPFVREKFRHPENLVIATNYEECAYMYYLGSKVTIGYVGKNLAEDQKIQPDIIIYREYWGNFIPEISKLRESASYSKVSFPVVDYPVNNIPELRRDPIYHIFATPVTGDKSLMLNAFIRDE